MPPGAASGGGAGGGAKGLLENKAVSVCVSRQLLLKAPAGALGPSRCVAGKGLQLGAGVLLPSAFSDKVAAAEDAGAACSTVLLSLAPAGA